MTDNEDDQPALGEIAKTVVQEGLYGSASAESRVL
jgi:hypothetical protein